MRLRPYHVRGHRLLYLELLCILYLHLYLVFSRASLSSVPESPRYVLSHHILPYQRLLE